MNFSEPGFLDKLRRRDEAAVESLVRAYTDHLLRASLAMGFDETAAGEVVQATWSTFYDVVPRFEGRSHVRTFLFGILYNKVSEARREHAKAKKHDPIEEIVESRFAENGRWGEPPVDPERFALVSERMAWVRDCIEALPTNQRMAFCLKEIDGSLTADICKILSVTTTHLGVILFRARNRLRECLEGKAKQG